MRGDALSHSWNPPGWKLLDPSKELQAMLAGVDGGVDTLTRIAKSQGREFSKIVAQRKLEIEAMDAAGVSIVHSTLTRDPQAQNASSGGGESREPNDDDRDR